MQENIEQIVAKALEKMDNDRYKLSIVVAKRAEELANGDSPRVDLDKNKVKYWLTFNEINCITIGDPYMAGAIRPVEGISLE